MYPFRACLVNGTESGTAAVRTSLDDNAVPVEHEFVSVDAVFARWPAPPDAARRLFVVRVRSLDDAAQLGRLQANFPGWPVMALVDGDCDVSGLYRVSRAGAAQILPGLFPKEDFNAALDRLLLQFGTRSTACQVIAVGGVTEGCGATSLAVNLAAELAALGHVPCVVTELSFGIGRIAGLLNVAPVATTRDLLTGATDPDMGAVQAALVKSGDHLSVLAGQHQSLEPFQPPAGRIGQLFRLLRHTAQFVIADLPYTFDPYYFEAVSQVNRVLLVTRQDVPAVQAAKLLTQSLAERGGPAVSLLVNRYDPERSEFSPANLSERLHIPTVYPVADDESGFRSAANAGKPLREVAPVSPAVIDLRHIASDLLSAEGIPHHTPRPTVWDKAKTFFTHLKG